MHLLEIYALTTGSKIKKPFIQKKYFPLPFEKYITIQNSSGMPAKCYSYFQEVINFIFPLLEKHNIKIIQIGSKEDQVLAKTVPLHGQTNINQTAYILSNSLLHIGNDSFAVHMASAFNIPLIALYSVSSPEIAGPFWKNNNQICLVPNGNWKPSFNPNENPKKIDSIKIEIIVNAIEKLLFDKIELNIKTKFIGEKFTHRLLESLPDQVLSPQVFPNELLNIRFDYKSDYVDLNSTAQNLNIRPCAIITDHSLELEQLHPFFKNLKLVIYDITKGVDISFIEKINALGLQNSIIFFKDIGTEEELVKRKIEMIDLPNSIEEVTLLSKDSPEKLDKNDIFRTNKILFADNKIYASKAGFLEKKEILLTENDLIFEQKIKDIDNLELLKQDFQYGLIYSK